MKYALTNKLKSEYCLYLSVAINCLGSWLTFLAIAIILNRKYGSHHVPLSFLIQSLPPILLSPFVSKFIARDFKAKIYGVINFLLAVNVFFVAFNQTIYNLYAYLVIGSVLSAIQKPIMDSLYPDWFSKNALDRIYSRVGSINSIMLMFAPPLGGLISVSFSPKVLMVVDGATFLLATAVIWPLLLLPSKSKFKTLTKPRLFAFKHNHLNQNLKGNLYLWYSFIFIGGIYNGIEFFLFNEHGLNSQDIGILLGFWGLGGLISFAFIDFLKTKSLQFYLLIYSFSFFLFVTSHSYWLLAMAFIAGGLASGLASGKIRSLIQKSITNEDNLTIWSMIASRMAVINCICYGGSALIIEYANSDIIKTTTEMSILLFLFLSLKLLKEDSRIKIPSFD